MSSRFDPAWAASLPQPPALPGLVPYVTAGHPRLRDTADLLLAAQDAGCSAVEVGIPFSDPLADGPTIQASSHRALGNGMTTSLALEQVADARTRGLRVPMAVMTYVNPVLAHGLGAFAADAAAAGVDGVIGPDLPLEEAPAVRDALACAGLALIPLVAPTTPPQRLRRICADAAGFLYCVGVTGVTGAREEVAPEALRLLEETRTLTALPRALGFGLASHRHLRALAGRAELAVVGSALIRALEAADDPVQAAARFLRDLRSGAPDPGPPLPTAAG